METVPVLGHYLATNYRIVPRLTLEGGWRRSLTEQAVDGELQGLGAGLAGVVGGDEVAADHHPVRRHAADLDIVLIRAERPEQRAHELHPPVVAPPQPVGDSTVAPRPVPHR